MKCKLSGKVSLEKNHRDNIDEVRAGEYRISRLPRIDAIEHSERANVRVNRQIAWRIVLKIVWPNSMSPVVQTLCISTRAIYGCAGTFSGRVAFYFADEDIRSVNFNELNMNIEKPWHHNGASAGMNACCHSPHTAAGNRLSAKTRVSYRFPGICQ
jgi:hypothetical protein